MKPYWNFAPGNGLSITRTGYGLPGTDYDRLEFDPGFLDFLSGIENKQRLPTPPGKEEPEPWFSKPRQQRRLLPQLQAFEWWGE